MNESKDLKRKIAMEIEKKDRGSKAVSAAEKLVDFVNSYSSDYESFANYICNEHRTLQQSVMRLFIFTIGKMAEVGTDERNEAAVKLAKKITEIAKDYNLPLIQGGKNVRHSELEWYKIEAKRAAKDLLYGKAVIEKIDKAKTENEITRIMKNARKRGEE